LAPGCLPKTVGGDLNLPGLTTLAPGCLPKTVGGDLNLPGLTKENREKIRRKFGK